MSAATQDSEFSSLVTHKLRKDWGVGVLVGETEGKRHYLFENGGERTLARAFFEMIRRVDEPDPAQQAAYARLKGKVAGRAHDGADASQKAATFSFLDQIARLRERYPEGLSDPKWISETRGDNAEMRAPQHRQAMIRDAQERLSSEALNSLTKAQHFDELWEQVLTVLRQTDLVPKAQLKSKPAHPEQLRNLALALRDLLYGKAAFGARFDHYLGAFQAAFGQRPGWELATAPCALVHPTEHVCVDPRAFRKQQRANSAMRPIAAHPSSAGYASCLGLARLVANKLAEQGEPPRDLLEVRDFVAFTAGRGPKHATG